MSVTDRFTTLVPNISLTDDQKADDTQIGNVLVRVAGPETVSAGYALSLPAPKVPDLNERARNLFNQRKARRRCFGKHAEMFQEHGWDILLELYSAQANGKSLAATSLSYAVGASQTTALRWLKRLAESGLVEIGTDLTDGRVRRVKLSDQGTSLMNEYLKRV